MTPKKNLLVNCLFNRKQSGRIGQELSEPQKATCGVPQGSILGPLLFLLTFNDIESVLKHLKIFTYADDTEIYFRAQTTSIIEDRLTGDFKSLASWLESMGLVCNMKKGKTVVMLLLVQLKR